MNVDWDAYKAAIQVANDNWFKQPITWVRQLANLNEFSEDGTPLTSSISLECLVFYNEFRTWPVTDYTETGEIDKQTLTLYFHLKTLQDLGYLNGDGNWDFDPAVDYFILQGIELKCSGWTNLSQTTNEPTLVQLIMQRRVKSNG